MISLLFDIHMSPPIYMYYWDEHDVNDTIYIYIYIYMESPQLGSFWAKRIIQLELTRYINIFLLKSTLKIVFVYNTRFFDLILNFINPGMPVFWKFYKSFSKNLFWKFYIEKFLIIPKNWCSKIFSKFETQFYPSISFAI